MPVNPGDNSLEAEIMSLKRRVADLERANAAQNTTIDSGGITLKSGGTIEVIDPTTGNSVLLVGALDAVFDRAGGVPQQGFRLTRADDGTDALILADFTPTVPPYKQALQWLDRAQNIIIADDTNGGIGLAKPYVSGGTVFTDTNVVRWPQTTSSSFVTIADSWYTIQNPRLQWDISMVCDSGTAGQVQLWVNNLQVDVTKTVGTSFIDWFKANVPIPGSWSLGDTVYVNLMARRTSGTGGVYATVQRFMGDQSP